MKEVQIENKKMSTLEQTLRTMKHKITSMKKLR